MIFASSKKTRQTYIMHPAIMEGGTFSLVAFSRSQSWCHVADADNGQFTQLSAVDNTAKFVAVPRIQQIHIHCAEQPMTLGFFASFNHLPLMFNAISQGLFRDDVFTSGQCSTDLPHSDIGQGANQHHLNIGSPQHTLLVVAKLSIRRQLNIFR